MARSLGKALGLVMNAKVMMLPVFFFWDYMAHIQVPQWLSLVFYRLEALANGESNIKVLVPDGEEGRRYALTQGENRGGLVVVVAYDSADLSVKAYDGGAYSVLIGMLEHFRKAMSVLPGVMVSIGPDIVPLRRLCPWWHFFRSKRA